MSAALAGDQHPRLNPSETPDRKRKGFLNQHKPIRVFHPLQEIILDHRKHIENYHVRKRELRRLKTILHPGECRGLAHHLAIWQMVGRTGIEQHNRGEIDPPREQFLPIEEARSEAPQRSWNCRPRR
jgi:hypothetical protein